MSGRRNAKDSIRACVLLILYLLQVTRMRVIVGLVVLLFVAVVLIVGLGVLV